MPLFPGSPSTQPKKVAPLYMPIRVYDYHWVNSVYIHKYGSSVHRWEFFLYSQPSGKFCCVVEQWPQLSEVKTGGGSGIWSLVPFLSSLIWEFAGLKKILIHPLILNMSNRVNLVPWFHASSVLNLLSVEHIDASSYFENWKTYGHNSWFRFSSGLFL